MPAHAADLEQAAPHRAVSPPDTRTPARLVSAASDQARTPPLSPPPPPSAAAQPPQRARRRADRAALSPPPSSLDTCRISARSPPAAGRRGPKRRQHRQRSCCRSRASPRAAPGMLADVILDHRARDLPDVDLRVERPRHALHHDHRALQQDQLGAGFHTETLGHLEEIAQQPAHRICVASMPKIGSPTARRARANSSTSRSAGT